MYVPSTACDFISFNSHQQLWHLTWAGGRDLSNHTQMSMIQFNGQRKMQKNSSHYPPTIHLHFIPSNPIITKAFPNPFPTKYEAWLMSSKKIWGKKRKGKEEENENVQGVSVRQIFCFLCMPELQKLTCSIRNRRLWSDKLINNILGHFGSFSEERYEDLQKASFGNISWSKWVNLESLN